jgi:hypothetical protein
VLGGGNVKHLEDLPKGCRRGDNANAFIGGFRLWMENKSADEHPSRRQAKRAPEDQGRKNS